MGTGLPPPQFIAAVDVDVLNLSVAANAINIYKHAKAASSFTRFIVTVGRSICALGYAFNVVVDANAKNTDEPVML